MQDDPIQEILDRSEQQMTKSVDHLRSELNAIRTGRATPAMLENVRVEYYGNVTPINQVASISAPQADLLLVQPWDTGAIEPIEKAIMQANMGLNPSNDGQMIRVPVPALSEERRKELANKARDIGEETKIASRNLRRSSKNEIQEATNKHNLSEDVRYGAEEELQEITDKSTAAVDSMLDKKEKEILTV